MLSKTMDDFTAMKQFSIRFSQYVRGRYGVFRGPRVLPQYCIGEVYRGDGGLFYFIPKSDPQAVDLYYGKSRMEAVNSFYGFY